MHNPHYEFIAEVNHQWYWELQLIGTKIALKPLRPGPISQNIIFRPTPQHSHKKAKENELNKPERRIFSMLNYLNSINLRCFILENNTLQTENK